MFAGKTLPEAILLALQVFQVLFLWVHDWIPLGRLNDVAAVRKQDTTGRLILVTLVQSVPFTTGLVYSWRYFGRSYPAWLDWWLWISYGVLFVGQLRAWWVPYLVKADPCAPSGIRKCLATRTRFCRFATGWSLTRHIFFSMSQRPLHC